MPETQVYQWQIWWTNHSRSIIWSELRTIQEKGTWEENANYQHIWSNYKTSRMIQEEEVTHYSIEIARAWTSYGWRKMLRKVVDCKETERKKVYFDRWIPEYLLFCPRKSAELHARARLPIDVHVPISGFRPPRPRQANWRELLDKDKNKRHPLNLEITI